MKKLLLLTSLLILLFCSSYTATASIYDGGLRTVKTMDNGIANTMLIVGRGNVNNSELIIQASTSIAPTTFTLTGYAYQSNITIENECSDAYHGRYIINNWPGATLAAGGYIQADGDDIALAYEGSTEDAVTAMVGTGGNTLILDYYNLSGYSSADGTIYMGNPTMSRDQWWIANEGDVTYIVDDNSLDITTNLQIETDIYLPKNPDSEQVLVSKSGAYEVLIDSTPQIIFNLYGSGGGAGYSGSGSPSSTVSSTLVLVE